MAGLATATAKQIKKSKSSANLSLSLDYNVQLVFSAALKLHIASKITSVASVEMRKKQIIGYLTFVLW